MTHLVAVGGSDAGISAAPARPRTRPHRGRHRASSPTPTPTSPSAASPTTSPARSPTGATSPTAPPPTSRPPACSCASTPSPPASTSPARRRLHVRTPDGRDDVIPYDALVVGTGAVPVRPPIDRPDRTRRPRPDDGVHLLHSMGDTFAVTGTLDRLDNARHQRSSSAPATSAWRWPRPHRARHHVTQIEALPEVLPTVDPELGALVHAELDRHGVEVLTAPPSPPIARAAAGSRPAARRGPPGRRPVSRDVDLVLVVVGVRPDTDLAGRRRPPRPPGRRRRRRAHGAPGCRDV